MEVGLRNYTARQLEEGMTVANRIVGDSSKLLEGRASRVYLCGRFPSRSFVVLVLLLAILSLGTACERTKAALGIPSDCQIKDASLSSTERNYEANLHHSRIAVVEPDHSGRLLRQDVVPELQRAQSSGRPPIRQGLNAPKQLWLSVSLVRPRAFAVDRSCARTWQH